MKFPADAPVTDRKKDDLRERIERLRVDLGEVSSAVVLRYPALSLTVKWSRERSRALNRFLALRELVDEIEERVSPETSERLKERARIRERKRRRRRRRKNG
ncbi:MAG: peptide chain release factor family protein [Planctomycetota bacterium]|jgi:protein subunit release factor B